MTSCALWADLDRHYSDDGLVDGWRGRAGDVVLSAPHAVTHQREGQAKKKDLWTGSLVESVAERTSCGFLATVGQQSGDPNWDHDHPYRQRLAAISEIVLDVHGMRDDHGVDVCIGRGEDPSPFEIELAERLVRLAESHGLRAQLDDPFPASPRTITHWLRGQGVPCLQLELAYSLRDSYPERTAAFLAEAAQLAKLMQNS